MAARYLSASVSLENCADELFEEGCAATAISIWQTGWAYPSRGNLQMLSLSRTSTCPPKEMPTWRGRPRTQKL
eukprot:5766589-Pyramimonas_sp.AAC.1